MFRSLPDTPQARYAHAEHKGTLLKFTALVTILAGYFLYLSWKFDASTGFGLALLTWSFFVLCTPVADGGFILAFPIRLLFGVRMAMTQIAIWFAAIGINLFMLGFSHDTYRLTLITHLLERILTEPYPYWSILAISAAGTFLSIYFGDEIMDATARQKPGGRTARSFRHRTLAVVALTALSVFAYYQLLGSLGIALPDSPI